MKNFNGVIFASLLLVLPGISWAGIPDIEAAVMNKDYAQARDLASGVMKNSRDAAQRTEAQYYYGLAQLRLGQYGPARDAFQAVMGTNPSQDVYDKAALSLTEGFYLEGFYTDALEAGNSLLK